MHATAAASGRVTGRSHSGGVGGRVSTFGAASEVGYEYESGLVLSQDAAATMTVETASAEAARRDRIATQDTP
jgi:hypothetical protein